ncbi:hypothetical protein JRI60_33460 [Archangium violaceum]|uniref:hypothetical protein n=1 Tax=Archangium violaceum TaxID=83451 RepID=UPI00195178BF|nr:hypothetical protein [Archangium violaceum]QRN94036.1 hypothetical protein JRI60_33460 [Archangium violaceum]
MSQMKLNSFASRPPLKDIVKVPERVQSVYSLTQHVWAGESDAERTESRKNNKVRLETLDEFFLDPVRAYLNRILEKVAEGEGQGFWVQAEFGVGKSHLMAATAVLAIGGSPAWDRVKQREKEENRAGPGARLDALWRKKLEGKKIFPIVFSLEGCGGSHEKKLEDFVLEEAQATFGLREGKPLAVYPEEHLARLFLKEHQKAFRDDLRVFLADKRLMRGLPQYEYDELVKALQDPQSQRDSGRVLTAFYRHKNLMPRIPTERGERLARAVQDILEAGYHGVFVAIDEMSEYLRRSQFTSDDEDCLLTLSSTLAKARALPIWTLVAAQSEHTNPKKIIGPDRLREELLEHKAERFRDIVVQRTRTISDPGAVAVYYSGYKNLVPWVKDTPKEEFESAFPFPPDAIQVIRAISTRLTGTRSTISFLHRALKRAVETGDKDLVPLWKVFDDLMSYNETPSTSSSGAISIRSKFRGEVAALDAAQATLKRITDGQLARPQNRSRAERILNTLFLYHLAGVQGLTKEQILDTVCDLKPNEDELEAQLGHYETILEEMRGKLRNQVRLREGRYEFVPKETGQYDDLVSQATDRLKSDPMLFWQYMDRLMVSADPDAPSPFSEFVPEEDWRQLQVKTTWHGQERSGRVTAADLLRQNARPPEIDTHGNEDDFLVVLARRPMSDKDVEKFLKADAQVDPRLVVWAPAEPSPEEKSTFAAVLAHLLVAEEHKNSAFEKDGRREFRREATRAHTLLQAMYVRGAARTGRTSLDVSMVRGVRGAIESMAQKAMDTCYRSRVLDFGNRKFDALGAVKLVNGLVKRGQAVSEGDQLWSAVENFAGPLGLVRTDNPRRLDPTGSVFFGEIRKRVEERGGAGLEIRTVYNWFTGYDAKDGNESPGLTRRMVDIYLLCLAQQGQIRISDKKGGWIDRATIGEIDFKPEHFRNLNRIELPKALPDWQVFCPYLEVLLQRSDGSLGPKYDKAVADDALAVLRNQHWVRDADVNNVMDALRDLFGTLGPEQQNPFDDLLIYWLQFAEEIRSAPVELEEVFQSLCRAVLVVSGAGEPSALTSEHLTTFRENRRRFVELRDSFETTRLILLRAARLARAQLPTSGVPKQIERAQADVLDELKKVAELVVNPDTVKTRLEPRFRRLEEVYVPAYLDALMSLDSLQADVEEARRKIEGSAELRVLGEFSGFQEAGRILEKVRQESGEAPRALRRRPEDRDAAEQDARATGSVLDVVDNEVLTFRRLSRECDLRREALTRLLDTPRVALRGFASFLRSPRVHALLQAVEDGPKSLSEVLEAQSDEELTDALLTMPGSELKTLAKLLAAVVGDRRPKSVRIGDFEPRSAFLWEASDIDTVVDEFREYLTKQWEDGYYLKIEKE